MFDIAPTELLLVALVALVVIGPKDLPRVLRVAGQWMARARGITQHFRTGVKDIIRQSEIEEMERKWATQNGRIMSEHPPAREEATVDAPRSSATESAPSEPSRPAELSIADTPPLAPQKELPLASAGNRAA